MLKNFISQIQRPASIFSMWWWRCNDGEDCFKYQRVKGPTATARM